MESSNRLLSTLPPDELEWLLPHLEPVVLRRRQVLHWPRDPIEHAYFVEEGLVSVLARTGEREEVEVWLIGREGVVGFPAALSGAVSPYRRVVQVGGKALRIAAAEFRHAVDQRPVLRHYVLRYAQAVLVQAGQNGACAARHSVEQRVARWLLQARDSLGQQEVPMTHALLSRLIGVRRASVTVMLGHLEDAGILRQERGGVTIPDPERLQQVTCDCYRAIRAAHDAI